jgi:type IV secretory pathway VirB10-like protein
MNGIESNNAGSHSTAPKTSEEIARTLRLQPERPPVTRLSRKVLASGTALALLLVSAAFLWALQNSRTRGPVSEELYSTDHHNVADGLAGLPRDYAGIPRDVPRLGPPLPGDLGRPIVAAQAQSGPLAVDAEQQRMNQEKRGRAHQQGLCVNECSSIRGDRSRRDHPECCVIVRRGLCSERTGSQARLRQCLDRSPDHESRSRDEAGFAVRRAGRVRDISRTHHGSPF